MKLAKELRDKTKQFVLQQNDLHNIDYSAIWVNLIDDIFPDLKTTPSDYIADEMKDVAKEGLNAIRCDLSQTICIEYRRHTDKLTSVQVNELRQLIRNTQQYAEGSISCRHETFEPNNDVVIRFETNDRCSNGSIAYSDYQSSSYYKIVINNVNDLLGTIDFSVRIYRSVDDCIKLLKNQGFKVKLSDLADDTWISWDVDWMKTYQRIKEA